MLNSWLFSENLHCRPFAPRNVPACDHHDDHAGHNHRQPQVAREELAASWAPKGWLRYFRSKKKVTEWRFHGGFKGKLNGDLVDLNGISLGLVDFNGLSWDVHGDLMIWWDLLFNYISIGEVCDWIRIEWVEWGFSQQIIASNSLWVIIVGETCVKTGK